MARRLPPITHEVAAGKARGYANRVLRARMRRDGPDGIGPDLWIQYYLLHYRYLTGRPRNAGPYVPDMRTPKQRRDDSALHRQGLPTAR